MAIDVTCQLRVPQELKFAGRPLGEKLSKRGHTEKSSIRRGRNRKKMKYISNPESIRRNIAPGIHDKDKCVV